LLPSGSITLFPGNWQRAAAAFPFIPEKIFLNSAAAVQFGLYREGLKSAAAPSSLARY
jgi:hypothetical protein